MKFEAELRNALIENTIHAIAEGGFENATVKEIVHGGISVPGVKMNDVYVYRLFGGKENLYRAAFSRLDKELFLIIKKAFTEASGFFPSDKERMYDAFLSIWRFIILNEDRCRCYIRSYYSVYIDDETREEHQKLFDVIFDSASIYFKKEADVFAILHSVFISMLDFGLRVLNRDLEDNDENRPHIFNVLYCMMASYFLNSKDEIAGCRV